MALRASTALAAVTLALVAAPAQPAPHAAAKQMPTLRVMLHPHAAAQGMLPHTARARLEAIAGTPLSLTGTTRTGALELALGGPSDATRVDIVARKLRSDRSVLWAETVTPRASTKASAAGAAAAVPGRKFLVRLHDTAPDFDTLLPRLSARASAALSVERAIGNVWVMSLLQAVPMSQLEQYAQAIESDPAVRYADPVRPVHAKAAPNDTYFAQQWSLTDSLGGIRIDPAWALGTGSADVTVAVVDTGLREHPDLAGRVLPGFDFISEAARARDGDGRDADPRDEGDWLAEGECGAFFPQDSSWHGTYVSGLIAANANNGVGIAGVNWAAKILPVRALGRCGGTMEDIVEGMLWASGVTVPGAPPNAHPAKVINMSLGGYGSCAGALQEAVDFALAQGTVVVVSAGNETDDTSIYSPAGCGGVVTVGATGRSGERAGYSNFGRRVDVSAPGGDGYDDDGLMISLSNDGAQQAGEPAYRYAMGTSAAAPMVSGVVSLMLARNPNLTAGQVLSILQGTARDFPLGTSCRNASLCGTGLLDAGTAIASTRPAFVDVPPGTVPIVEFYDATLDHYLVTADAQEMAALDQDARWQRTGHAFYGYADPVQAPVPVASVCRFHAGQDVQIDSYFLTADAAECSFMMTSAPDWQLETPQAFWIELPQSNGACRSGTVPVYRFFNNRRDASQRFTIDLSVRRAMTNRAWVADGPADDGVAFCSAI